MNTYEVSQRIIQTLVYHVEANSAKEAAELVNGGQVGEAYEINGDIKSTRVKVLQVSKD